MKYDAIIGVVLALLLLTAWAGLLAWSLFFWNWREMAILAPVIAALQCWLYVGIFIVAHDAIHGTIWPGARRFNRAVGTLCLLLYAGFRFSKLAKHHREHHKHPGSALDPDFCENAPRSFATWYLSFFRHYFGAPQFLTLAAATGLLVLTGVELSTLLLFWAAPAVLSSVQLFYFGTYLPHRHEEQDFCDRHNARDLHQSWLFSLITCFHFGHHHTHHDQPSVPWWRLPFASKDLSHAQP